VKGEDFLRLPAFFKRHDQYLSLLAENASNIHQAAAACLEMVEDFKDVREKAERIKAIESKGDVLTHQLIDRLVSSGIPPFDREDLMALAGRIDDVLDEIEGFANRMCLFEISRPTPECVEILKGVLRAAELLEEALRHLSRFEEMRPFLLEIDRIEKQVDEISRRVIGKLFRDESLPVLDLIKWKEIYARLEHTTDRMEDVAEFIGDMARKNG
jgi:uncharacterized protein